LYVEQYLCKFGLLINNKYKLLKISKRVIGIFMLKENRGRGEKKGKKKKKAATIYNLLARHYIVYIKFFYELKEIIPAGSKYLITAIYYLHVRRIKANLTSGKNCRVYRHSLGVGTNARWSPLGYALDMQDSARECGTHAIDSDPVLILRMAWLDTGPAGCKEQEKKEKECRGRYLDGGLTPKCL
jgi:hypothetical protein